MNSISYKLHIQDVIRPPFQDFLKTLSFRKTYLHTRRRDMFKYWFCYASSPMLPPSNYSKSRNLQWFRWSRSPWMYLILGMLIHLSPLASFFNKLFTETISAFMISTSSSLSNASCKQRQQKHIQKMNVIPKSFTPFHSLCWRNTNTYQKKT